MTTNPSDVSARLAELLRKQSFHQTVLPEHVLMAEAADLIDSQAKLLAEREWRVEAALKEAAAIARGEIVNDRYRHWPCWGTGNRDEDSPFVKLADSIANAILAKLPNPSPPKLSEPT